jgi:transcriptional regulator with XRE-family HTH domain
MNISRANLPAMQLSAYLKRELLTQEQAAAKFGCTQGRVSQLLSGAMPSLALAQRIRESTNGAVSISDWPAQVAASGEAA